ncbi:class I SAM-dependent methyltransferase [Acidithiobacillus ferrivorans]|uniref:class I SAM-dependent methyltransferase n=1 Tax=Acidithiobacillus ferrivorans TaxID=160808 RepID=UPI0009F6C9DA|nr:class I SAM-dependent methyltransferase [Acidithiobacillus ferrivorans]
MDKNAINEISTQRTYYTETARKYDSVHAEEGAIGLFFMLSAIDYLEIKTILDIGSGTGKVINFIKKYRPEINVVGIEPVRELRVIGHSNGIPQEKLIDGDATKLCFPSQSFDMVCEFAVLHHVKKPDLVVSEMIRVSSKAVFLVDVNNFGQGSYVSRTIKQLINCFGMWGVFDVIRTRGKGYHFSEGDGLFYSYSLFNNYKQIKRSCNNVHIFNVTGGKFDFYKTASGVAFLGVK